MKNAQNSNKSEGSLDHILVYIMNDLHRDRNERREVLHGYQIWASKHLHTLSHSQIVFMCKQLLALLQRYAWENMAEIPGRKPLSRHLTSAYKDVAERTLGVKTTRIAKGKGRSDKEWDDAALKVGMAMLRMQLVPEEVQALGPRQRRMAVALETKVVGQLSRGAAFWKSLTTKTAFYAEVKALLPLIASHLNKSRAPLQIAASWIVPRPVTHMCCFRWKKALLVSG